MQKLFLLFLSLGSISILIDALFALTFDFFLEHWIILVGYIWLNVNYCYTPHHVFLASDFVRFSNNLALWRRSAALPLWMPPLLVYRHQYESVFLKILIKHDHGRGIVLNLWDSYRRIFKFQNVLYRDVTRVEEKRKTNMIAFFKRISDRGPNHKINCLHERALCIAYNDYDSS